MPWNGIALVTSDVLGLVLVARLLSLRLHRVYRVFCAYVIYVLLSSSFVFVEASLGALDYRVSYLMIAVGSWILTFWMVYESLTAILARLPGILRFSRKLLLTVFAVSLVLAIFFARSEFDHDQSSYPVWSIEFAVVLVSVVERVVTTVSLLALLAIQSFLLWFPVQLPRNLVLFTMGFVFNFVCETALLVLRAFVTPPIVAIIDALNLFVLSACFGYFAIVITRAGESIPTRIGHRWHPAEQQRLVGRLEEINVALLKSVRN